MLGLGLSLQKGISAFNAGRALVSSYIRRVTEAGGVLQNTACDATAINELNQDRLLEPASWVLVPDGIKEDVVYAQKPTSGLGDLTFTRASDATYTDSTGVVRRSPYNLLPWSEDFTNAVWFKQQVNVSSNVAANPLNGLVNADLLVPDTTNNNHRIYNSGSVTAPSSNIMSVYAKAAGYNYISFGYAGGLNGSGIIFNLSNGTVSGSSSGFSGTMSPAGNGWYLCSFIGNGPTNDYSTPSRWIVIRDNSTNLVFTGDGTSGVLVANAQLVEGTSALDYFPTTNRQDVPRIDFRNADGTLSSCGRLLLEPQRTNSIRNSSMVGAVAGTPGTLPTNWSQNGGGGLTRTIVGIGTESGLPYIDIRLAGTATQAFTVINFEGTIAASAGQAWSSSVYAKLISGTLPTSNLRILTSGSMTQDTALNLTSSLIRYVSIYASLPVGTTTVQTYIQQTLAIGQTYDFTIRIAAPQMELGAYATTWVPTTTAATTRIGDAFTRTNIFTNGFITAAGGTWIVDFTNNFAFTVTNEIVSAGLEIGDSAGNSTNSFKFRRGGGIQRINLWKRVSSVDTIIYSPTVDVAKYAIKWNGTTADVFFNGVKVVSATSFTATNMQFLKYIVDQFPMYMNQSLLFPTPLSDDECEVLTSEGYGNYALLAQSLNCVLQ